MEAASHFGPALFAAMHQTGQNGCFIVPNSRSLNSTLTGACLAPMKKLAALHARCDRCGRCGNAPDWLNQLRCCSKQHGHMQHSDWCPSLLYIRRHFPLPRTQLPTLVLAGTPSSASMSLCMSSVPTCLSACLHAMRSPDLLACPCLWCSDCLRWTASNAWSSPCPACPSCATWG